MSKYTDVFLIKIYHAVLILTLFYVNHDDFYFYITDFVPDQYHSFISPSNAHFNICDIYREFMYSQLSTDKMYHSNTVLLSPEADA